MSFLAGEPADLSKCTHVDPSNRLVNDVSFHRHPTADDDQASSTLSPGVSNSIKVLPVEILQRIFTCCAEPRPPDHIPFPQVYPEWIAITYVSRHWRAVSLNHRPLWGSITPNLSPDWLKTLIVRSQPAPVDANIRVGQTTVKRICLCVDEVIGVLAGCTRLRSLKLVGPRRDVCAVLEALLTPTPIRSLTLSLWEPGPPVILPEGLFGGEPPIRHIHFSADRCIVPSPQFLRGVTHFTSGEQIPILYLLDALRQMPALTHFTLQHCRANWQETDAPRDLIVDMPHLTNLAVHADSPRFFVLLNDHLSLPKGAKRWLELRTFAVAGWDRWAGWFATFAPILEAANGLQHAYLSGGAKEGTFRVWTGGIDTVCEDAEFGFEMFWYGSPKNLSDSYPTGLASPIFHLQALCEILGASRWVRYLELDGHSDLPNLFWWELLRKLHTVEQLETHSGTVEALYSAWNEVDAPAVLPALQRVRFLQTETATMTTTAVELPLHRAAVRGGRFISRIMPSRLPWPEPPAHAAPVTNRITHGLSSASEPLVMHAETELGLIQLLHGGVGQCGG